MNSETTQPSIKSKEPTQIPQSQDHYSIPITDIHRQYGYNKFFNIERIKSVDFFLE